MVWIEEKDETMSEHQQLEYKQAWHDEYLKWICGFANADGGVLEIEKDEAGMRSMP